MSNRNLNRIFQIAYFVKVKNCALQCGQLLMLEAVINLPPDVNLVDFVKVQETYFYHWS
jgi:hypothetical protein